MKKATRCVYLDTNDQFGAISPPIYQTATFRQESADEFGEYDYSRSGNPTRDLLEAKLAELENARYAAAFSSGMAAITTLCRLLSAGDEIVAGNDLYGGTVRLFERIAVPNGIAVRYVNTADVDEVSNTVTDRTKLLFLETPTNPLLRIADMSALAGIAHSRGALLAVDNSVMSPVLQNPLDHGADVVVHSATKFLCGHSDVTAGALITNNEDLHRTIAFFQNAEGNALAPFDSWLLLRGLKTLDLRVERQNSNAQQVAEFLNAHPGVQSVFYPGLSDHAGHELHFRQAGGGGCVISFTTGDPACSTKIVESLRLFSIAVSFASVNSTVSMPCKMSHASIPIERADDLKPPGDLIRISVGIEDVRDLIEDLTAALGSASGSAAAAYAS